MDRIERIECELRNVDLVLREGGAAGIPDEAVKMMRRYAHDVTYLLALAKSRGEDRHE
jgi:hypothetical protein